MLQVGEQVKRVAISVLTLAACNKWVRPEPAPASTRTQHEQSASVVKIESRCDPFGNGTLGKSKVGTGVIVSDWQVLTALHVVDCPAAIPTIRVTNVNGLRWSIVPEREWEITIPGNYPGRDGISRLQMATADSFSPGFDPPAVTGRTPEFYDMLYIHTAYPDRHETVAQASGIEYGGAQYGGQIYTCWANTESGNSGSPQFDIDGFMIGLHLGVVNDDNDPMLRYGALVTAGMVPHRR